MGSATLLTLGYYKNTLDGVFWGLMRQGTPTRWDSSDLPWHWTLMDSMHKQCESILNDWTLRDTENHPPPKSLWFDSKEIDLWRKDMEAERKRKQE